MTGVVLRCPACGTTQSKVGECDACYEGAVRYFCANHEPGRWLDTPACNACGARFGETPRRRDTPAPEWSAPPRRRRDAERSPPPRRPRPRDEDGDRVYPSPPGPTIFDRLATILSGGRARRERGDDRDESALSDLPIALMRLRRFLTRLAMVAFVVLVLGFVAIALLLGGVFQMVDGQFR